MKGGLPIPSETSTVMGWVGTIPIRGNRYTRKPIRWVSQLGPSNQPPPIAYPRQLGPRWGPCYQPGIARRRAVALVVGGYNPDVTDTLGNWYGVGTPDSGPSYSSRVQPIPCFGTRYGGKFKISRPLRGRMPYETGKVCGFISRVHIGARTQLDCRFTSVSYFSRTLESTHPHNPNTKLLLC